MSEEHLIYLRKIKKRILIIKISQIILFFSIFLIWQLLADLNVIDSFITSSPRDIINTLIKLYNDNNLFIHIYTTLYEVLISFIISFLIGIVVATILWWNNILYKIIDPFLTMLNSLPKVALGPIIIIWFKAGVNSIIIMSLLISSIITIININDGFNKTDVNKIELLKTFNANKKQIFTKLVLPYNYKTIFNALKINISMTLIGVVMGEFLVSKMGIGYLIIYGSQIFNLSLVMSGIVILAIISFIMYYLILKIEKRLFK